MSNLNLKGFTKLGESTLSTDVVDNLISFFEWGLLEKGNYVNVTKDDIDVYGGEPSRLRLVQDPQYTDGQIWESHRKNWVWQSGVSSSPSPLVGTDDANPGVSGVYVDDVFYSTATTGTYAHHIDHANGRVVFDSPVDADSVVEAEFSYNYISVEYANGLPWFTELQYRSENSANFTTTASGDWSQFSRNRQQLPAIGVELTNGRSFRGYQLGGGQYVDIPVLFHCVAEDSYTRDQMVDVVSLQNDKTFKMYDQNAIATSSEFPIDYRGVPVSGAQSFPDLVSNFPGRFLRFKDATVDSVYNLSSRLYVGTVRATAEIIATHI